jgi:ribosome biogenesis protein YTM1
MLPIGGEVDAAPTQNSASTVQTTSVPMPLTSVCADASGKRLLTAGWDGCVAVWGTEEGREEKREQERTKKRRKAVNGTAEESSDAAPTAAASMSPITHLWHTPPINVLDKTPAANSRVSGAVWGADSDTCFSAGWDGAVRLWDVASGAATATKTSDKVLLCLDTIVGSKDVVISGHVDRSAALWDMRTSTTNISLSFAGAHAGPIGAIRRHPTSSHLFSTGSHDGQVKLWDTRSNHVALFSLVRPSKSKVLTMDWDQSGQTLVAGGEDCRLTVHQGEGIGRQDSTA